MFQLPGVFRRGTQFILLAALVTTAFAQTPPPVVLVNGYQTPPCDTFPSTTTFGDLEQRLTAQGRTVVWFNNCSVPNSGANRPTLEELASALGKRLAALTAPQVDVVAHSMGGLIVRAYLSGKSPSGSFAPPADHKVRKLVLLGSPHFGPMFGPTLSVLAPDIQAKQLLPGSDFLFDLATWNQGTDDLRSIDAVSVIGNPNSLASIQAASDGLVSTISASGLFALPDERVRIVPYCHTESGLLALASGCKTPPYLAAINSSDHLSWKIISSFLGGTDDWKSIGAVPSKDPTLSTKGGAFVVYRNENDENVTDVTKISYAGGDLVKGPTNIYYAEVIPSGPQTFSAASATKPANATATIPKGTYATILVKTGPQISLAIPAAAQVPTLSRAPGMFIAIFGANMTASTLTATTLPLPSILANTQVLVNNIPTSVFYVSPGQINAILPENAVGLVKLTVTSPLGEHSINVLIEAAVPAIFTQNGGGTGAASALNAVTGALITAAAPIKAGEVVSLYLTGLGATTLQNGLQYANLQPTVTLGGVPMTVTYAGRAPGFAGLDQINFVVDDKAPKGDNVELKVQSAGRVSNTATLGVK
jgi:uncharacterized protein (TIGR03437 family)